jgi:hypothetical protein
VDSIGQRRSILMNVLERFIADFTERAEQLADMKLADCPPIEVRNKQVEELIEQYYIQVGKYPKSNVLERLGSYILVHELKNKDVDKVTNTAFPILSEIQLKRRNRKQMLMQDTTIDFLNTKYNQQLDSLAKSTIKKVEY